MMTIVNRNLKAIIARTMIVLFALFHVSVSFASEEAPSDATRFVALTKEIRCVVCQNQSLAESTAPIADDLRQKIYTMILEKKSDAEIKDYLVKRYGEFILLRPRFAMNTWLLWLLPLFGVVGIAGYVWRFKPATT